MKRIAVVGSGGVGKTTFSEQLGARLGIPVVHLDRYFWKPDWTPTGRTEWVELQRSLLQGESWIADGNYEATFDVRFASADTVVILSLPRWRCIVRIVMRALKNRGRCVQADGCPERLDWNYVLWVWGYAEKSRPRLDCALERNGDHLSVIQLASTGEMREFLSSQV